ncbi:MAG: tetratricopeptide repeat protein [Gammaproteobacteria bacterium]|nr:tetratricopeptide repeat protein [Gammaproteobacteria bacterium]
MFKNSNVMITLNKKKPISRVEELKLADDDDLTRAKLLWHEWGKPIVIAVTLGFGGIGGFNYWQHYQAQNSESASLLYEQVLNSGDSDSIRNEFETLKNKHSSLLYSQLAAMLMAKLLVEEDRVEEAVSELRWVVKQSNDEKITHIARLRLFAIMLSIGEFEEVLDMIVDTEKDVFESRYQELLGDAYTLRNQNGDIELARNAYQASLNAEIDFFNRYEFVRAKLDNL